MNVFPHAIARANSPASLCVEQVNAVLLVSPIAGWVTPLEEVPDPVFAGRMLGDGLAVDPFESVVRAPCAATVTNVHRCKHAITLRTHSGAEILLHVGVDTVGLGGHGFETHVSPGDEVATGDRLVSFDADLIAEKAKSLMVSILIANSDTYPIAWRCEDGEIASGSQILGLALGDQPFIGASVETIGAEVERLVVVTAPHGLHARPAGVIATTAREFGSDVSLVFGEKIVSARGSIGIMGLGVRKGDEITIRARGTDADLAIERLASLVASDFGDDPGETVELPSASAALAPAPALDVPMAPPFAVGERVLLTGVKAAPGLALGTVVRVSMTEMVFAEHGKGVDIELRRLNDALAAARSRIEDDLSTSKTKSGPMAAILAAHLTFIEDPDLSSLAEAAIKREKSAEYAWREAVRTHVDVLKGLGNPRMAERISDLWDVERRVQSELSGHRDEKLRLPEKAVLFAEDLLPSQVADTDLDRVAGICTASGGATSHVAILAASLGIPAVVAAGIDVLRVPEGADVIVNADAAEVTVSPGPDALAQTRAICGERDSRKKIERDLALADCVMTDGTRVHIVANLGSVAEVKSAVSNGAEGCGLLRTEFLFLNRDEAPNEAEQFAEYQAIVDGLDGRPIIFRTLDAGADKALRYLKVPAEENPQLGLRGIRIGLRRPELLRTQFRAVLRTRPFGAARIMLPMVTSLSELVEARAILDEEETALQCAGHTPLGIMIEVPAAAMMAEELAEVAEFFSIGTNDLSQYVLAMDRMNPALAEEIDALHPAVLRMVAQTVRGARCHGRHVGVCGAAASDPLAAPILIGLGVSELSVAGAGVPTIKSLMRQLSFDQCTALAEEALHARSAREVRALVRGKLGT